MAASARDVIDRFNRDVRNSAAFAGQDVEKLHSDLTGLANRMPIQVKNHTKSNQETRQWIGELSSVLRRIDRKNDLITLTSASQLVSLDGDLFLDNGYAKIEHVFYSLKFEVEQALPPNTTDGAIDVNEEFKLKEIISGTLKTATTEILILDPYADDTILANYFTFSPDNVKLKLLRTNNNVTAKWTSSLKSKGLSWNQQFSSRQISIREIKFHDRAIIIDNKDISILSQSLKDFAKTSPGVVYKLHGQTAADYIDAFRDYWNNALVVL